MPTLPPGSSYPTKRKRVARPSDRWALPPSCPASSAAWLQPLHLWGPEPLPLQVCARQALGELTGFQEEGREAALQGGCPRPTSLWTFIYPRPTQAWPTCRVPPCMLGSLPTLSPQRPRDLWTGQDSEVTLPTQDPFTDPACSPTQPYHLPFPGPFHRPPPLGLRAWCERPSAEAGTMGAVP